MPSSISRTTCLPASGGCATRNCPASSTSWRRLRMGGLFASLAAPLRERDAPRRRRAAPVPHRTPAGRRVGVQCCRGEPDRRVRRGVRVAGLLPGPSAFPGTRGTAGVRTVGSEEIQADLVVDAPGRRTQSATWLAGLGARPPYMESENSGFTYYTRYFTGPSRPRRRGAALTPIGSFSVLTVDGDTTPGR